MDITNSKQAGLILLLVSLTFCKGLQADQLQCVVQTGCCDEILSLYNDSYYRLENRTDLAGKTLCLPAGLAKGLSLTDIVAEEENPVTIINCGGQVVFDSVGWSNGISILRSQYIHLSGSGDDTIRYGIVQKNANSIGLNADEGTSDIEIDHLEVFDNGYAGIVVRTYPRCFNRYNRNTWTLRNVRIHNNYVHDVGGEGFYVGTSHFEQGDIAVDPFDSANSCPDEMASEAELRHIKIHHNNIENTGLDGIQVGAGVEGVEVYNNSITFYALKQSYGHVGGLQINPGTTGKFYNNWIESGEYDTGGTAIQYIGGIAGPTDIYNNVIIGSPTAIMTLGRMGGADTPINIIHNTIVHSGTPYFFFCHTSDFIMDYTVKNNIFAGYENIGDNYWQDWSKIFSGSSEKCPINGQIYNASNDPDAFQFSGNSYAENAAGAGFVHLPELNLHLDTFSPAVGVGEDFLALSPIDFEGNPRSKPIDNGAFVYFPLIGKKNSTIFIMVRAAITSKAQKAAKPVPD